MKVTEITRKPDRALLLILKKHVNKEVLAKLLRLLLAPKVGALGEAKICEKAEFTCSK